MPFKDEHKARVTEIIKAEPCLFNARHKHDYVTMAAWLNEVVGDSRFATPDDCKAIMANPGPETWDAMKGVWVPVIDARTPEEVAKEAADAAAPQVDPWAEQRKALGDLVG